MVEQEIIGGIHEVLMLGADGLKGVVLGEPEGHVRSPPRKDVVTDNNVISLLDATNLGYHIRLDLLLSKGVHGESNRDGNEGLYVYLLVEVGRGLAFAVVLIGR